jgi:hypothetical protein
MWSVKGSGFLGSATLICKGKLIKMESLTQRHSVTFQKTLINCKNQMWCDCVTFEVGHLEGRV